jgi:hypothetical protein
MDKYPRETSPRELTDEEMKAVAGGGVGHAFGQSTDPANEINEGLGPVIHKKPV